MSPNEDRRSRAGSAGDPPGPDRAGLANRIDDVLADLGGQLEAAEAAELAAEVEDRTRREGALISAVDRLRASVGSVLSVATRCGTVSGPLTDVGPDWLRLRSGPASSAVIPLSAVVAVVGVTGSAVAPGNAGAVADRLDFRHLLRGVVRDRSPVCLVLADGKPYRGVLNGCGADFLELSSSAPAASGWRWLVPLSAVLTVHVG